MIDETEHFKKKNVMQAIVKTTYYISDHLTNWTRPEKWVIMPDEAPKPIQQSSFDSDNCDLNVDPGLGLIQTYSNYSNHKFRLLLLGSMMQFFILTLGQFAVLHNNWTKGLSSYLVITTLVLAVGGFFVNFCTLIFNKKMFEKQGFHYFRYGVHIFLLILTILNFSIQSKIPVLLKVILIRSLSNVPIVESKGRWASWVFTMIADCGLVLVCVFDSSIANEAPTITTVFAVLVFFLSYFVGFILQLGIDRRNKRAITLMGGLAESIFKQLLVYFHVGDLPKFSFLIDQDGEGNIKNLKRRQRNVNIRENLLAKPGHLEQVSKSNSGIVNSRQIIVIQDHSTSKKCWAVFVVFSRRH